MRLATRATVRVNPATLTRAQRAAETAARIVFPELNAAFQDALGTKAWDWPRDTYRGGAFRRDGSRTKGRRVPAGLRNIVDMGTLRASNSIEISGNLCTFRWAVGYATAVHYGANIHPWGDKTRPLVSLPARPWTSAVLGTIRIPGIEPYDYRAQYKASFIQAFRTLK
jgi:hypothetical protein